MSGRFRVLFRVLRIVRRIALWGTVTVFALTLAAFAINAFDERPSPQVLRLSRAPENRYKAEENIYVALAGFDAPPGKSVVVSGQENIARYNASVDTMLNDPLALIKRLPVPDLAGLKFAGSTDLPSPWKPSFWRSVQDNKPAIEQLLERNRELYERYTALFGMPGYYETARPSYAAPIYIVPGEVRSLFLANVALQLQAKDGARVQAGLKSLRQDMELWRRMLTGDGTLLSKMVAVAFLQKDSLVLSDMIADPGTGVPQNMAEFLPEFASSDWDISNAFAAEFRAELSIYQHAQALSDAHWQSPDATDAWRLWSRLLSPIEGQFFKINATKNLAAGLMNELARCAAPDPSTFATNQARLIKWQEGNANLRSIRTVYNPIGKILIAIAAPAYNNYPLRPYDAAALQRLVRLSWEIRQQQIPPSAVGAFMKRHPEWSTHPADGRPFLWKPATNEIAIQPVAQQPADRRISVQLWRPAES